MPKSLSIKDVPDDIAARLRARAAGNHRSLQGELMIILEEAVRPRQLTVVEVAVLLKVL
jgi:plasmid stability protein